MIVLDGQQLTALRDLISRQPRTVKAHTVLVTRPPIDFNSSFATRRNRYVACDWMVLRERKREKRVVGKTMFSGSSLPCNAIVN